MTSKLIKIKVKANSKNLKSWNQLLKRILKRTKKAKISRTITASRKEELKRITDIILAKIITLMQLYSTSIPNQILRAQNL